MNRWRSRPHTAAARTVFAAAALAAALAGCELADRAGPTSTVGGGFPAGPGEPATASAGAPSTETPVATETAAGTAPLPTPELYVVQRGETLTSIARRYGISVPQLLAANPQVKDPNTIRYGYPLTVPPRDSLAAMYRGGGGMVDPPEDTLDPSGRLTPAPGYADLTRFTTRFEATDLVVDLDAAAVPPPLDPEGDELRYVVQIDVSGDLEPDFEAVASNALTDPFAVDGPPFGLSLLDRRTDTHMVAPNVPGTVGIVDKRLEIRLSLAALGEPEQVAVVALAQRDFYPDGRTSPDSVESSIDRAPDQQWPRANPRWLIVTRAP